MAAPRALVIGALGQDGSYLMELLYLRGYEIWGMYRRRPSFGPRWTPDLRKWHQIEGSIVSRTDLIRALDLARPDEIYNVAAVTSPGSTWATEAPAMLGLVNALGPVNLLSAMRESNSKARLIQASSSAIYDPYRYGLYGASKLLAHDAVWGHRAELGMHVSSAVLYSHTSVRQSADFLAPYIVRGLAAIARGETKSPMKIALTDLDARRDWGWARDYANAMIMMAERDTPGDCVVMTGRQHSVREFVEIALAALQMPQTVHDVIELPEDCVPCRSFDRSDPVPPEHISRPPGWEPLITFEGMVGQMAIAEKVRSR